MRKNMFLMMLLASVTLLTSCLSENDMEKELLYEWGATTGNNGGNNTPGNGELLEFNVQIDRTTAEPTAVATAYYPEEEDDISKQDFTTLVNIDMSNPTAKTENGVEITVSDGHVTANHGSVENVCYVVSGTTTNGSLTIDGKTNYEVNLNGVDITNPQTTALDLESKKAAYIVLTGSNKLTDGTDADHKGALYAKGKLIFSGTGSLDVYGVYNNGIHSKSYIVFNKGVNVYVNTTVNHGIKASDAVVINGGILNVETSGAGAKGINCEKDIFINGGRTTVISTGNGEWDEEDQETKAAVCIKTDSILTMKGGEVYVKATGSGGKGLKADWEAYIYGGKIRIITTGGLYYNNGTTESHNYTGNTDNLDDAYTSSPKGIKIGTKNEHGVLTITDGDIMIRTTGNNAEGMESKGTLDISGGKIVISAHDDAINSSSDMTISGGTVIAVGTNNDAIDTNGDMYLKGGTIIAMGGNGAETGIDIDEQHNLYITGSSLFSIGGRTDARLGSTSQGIICTSGSVTANGTVTVKSGNTTIATFTMPPYSCSNGTMLITDPGLTSGNSYTLTSGSSSTTVTASNTLSGSGAPGGGGGPGGGGFPGGW